MNTIQNYIGRALATTFFMSVLVLAFVVSIGLVFKAVALLSNGASLKTVVLIIGTGFPGTMTFVIPLSLVVSVFLVFNHFSADREIQALQTCGVGLATLMRVPVLMAVLFSLLCFHLNNEVVPENIYSRRNLKSLVKTKDLAALIEPGRVIHNFNGYNFYAGWRDGKDLRDILVSEPLGDGRMREIRAKTAEIIETNGQVLVRMGGVSVTPMRENRPGGASAEKMVLLISSDKAAGKKTIARRTKDKQTWNLVKDVVFMSGHTERLELSDKEYSQIKTEISNRLCRALACVCFVVVAVPCSIKRSRRESSVGLVLTLSVVVLFYLASIFCESLGRYPIFHAHYLALLPVLLSLSLGIALVHKTE